ncbi:hypothetical protein H8D85_01045 [bacterium]|nr:hypothetical protein [bacterium]
MDSGNIKSTLEASKKLVGKGDPGMFRRGFAKAQENLSTLITNPKKFGKRILNDIRYKTVDASKIVDGKIENNMFRKLFTGKTHRAVDSIGFHGGKQVIKRTPLGMLGTAGVTSGLGMGAFEFAGNGTDEQGNKRGLMNRLGRTAVETAKYTIAPGLAGVYDVGSFALSKVNEKAKKYKTDPLATMQSGRNNSINY